jgi:1-deoxy-D-xylulose-5-phosphate reductoisomerase
MKNIALFGSTGYIGRSVLDVIARQPDEFRAYALVAGSQHQKFKQQIEWFKPEYAALPIEVPEFRKQFPEVRFFHNEEGYEQIASLPAVDLVVMAIPGLAGLRATMHALECGKMVALATKEIIVSGGPLIKKHLKQILPLDSEHNAIFQILRSENSCIEQIILTASGGPFIDSPEDLSNVSLEQVLKHPVWKMGRKITVDSATLMNKGLELIEACRLFGLEKNQVSVVMHPEAIVHGFVLFTDGFLKGVLSLPDMRYSIAYCLNYPQRQSVGLPLLHPVEMKLTFRPLDERRFPCVALARNALESGDSYPVVLNAADDEAVKFFLDGKINFGRIPVLVEQALNLHSPVPIRTIDDVFEVDRSTRIIVRDMVGITG